MMMGSNEVFVSDHGAHLLLVKNTFLDIDVLPEQEEARRAFTAPPLGRVVADDDDDDIDDDGSDDASSEGNAPAEDVRQVHEGSPNSMGDHAGADVAEDDVPEIPEIGRLRTATISYESHKDWVWAQEGPMFNPVPEPFVMYPVMCPQLVNMVPVMMSPIGDFPPAGLVSSGDIPPPWGGIQNDSAGVGGYGDVSALAAVPPQPPANVVVNPAVSPASVPLPQTLTATPSVSSNCFRVRWNVDARKLSGNDKRAVSPPFELFLGPAFPSVPCRILLHPNVVNEGKGGSCFRKAKGKGFVQLKCEQKLAASVSEIAVRISIGDDSKKQAPRGPVRHSFFSNAVCGLPKDQEAWNFLAAVDKESGTFAVCIEIVA